MSRTNNRPISKLGQDGTLYGANDITEGEYSVNGINARVSAQAQAFEDQYQTTSQGDNDARPLPISQMTASLAQRVTHFTGK